MKSPHKILFRRDKDSEQELNAAMNFFPVYFKRSDIPRDSIVIGRYSVLPYYKELEDDLKVNRSKLINSYSEHKYIADFEWYEDLKDFTMESWDDNNFYLSNDEGPFIVKGKTNSKKHKWNKLMYAATRRDASLVASQLLDDMCIVEQGVVYRKYVPLKTYEIGINGLRFTNEWRFFYYRDKCLCSGYYWTSAEKTDYTIDEECKRFADKVAKEVAQHTNFFVLDVAEKENGGWILVEINDGQMSGLSMCNESELYGNLSKCLSG